MPSKPHWEAAIALIGEEATRVWRLYLAGGRLAFAQGRMGVDQILLARQEHREKNQETEIRHPGHSDSED